MKRNLKIAFVQARWHSDIVERALKGFENDMEIDGRPYDLACFEVPGAFEMPLLAKKLAQRGDYDAIVCAALVVDGGIYRHDFVAAAVVNGLMQAQMDTGVPVYSVSLTPHHFQPIDEHKQFFSQHFMKKGAEAAQAVRMVADLEVNAE